MYLYRHKYWLISYQHLLCIYRNAVQLAGCWHHQSIAHIGSIQALLLAVIADPARAACVGCIRNMASSSSSLYTLKQTRRHGVSHTFPLSLSLFLHISDPCFCTLFPYFHRADPIHITCHREILAWAAATSSWRFSIDGRNLFRPPLGTPRGLAVNKHVVPRRHQHRRFRVRQNGRQRPGYCCVEYRERNALGRYIGIR